MHSNQGTISVWMAKVKQKGATLEAGSYSGRYFTHREACFIKGILCDVWWTQKNHTKVLNRGPEGSKVVPIVFNRPGVAGDVLQTPLWFIHSLRHWWFVKISSKHLHFQTIRAKELTFWEKVHHPPHVTLRVTYHMSHVTCHVSRVMYHVSHVTWHWSYAFLDKLVKLVINNNNPIPKVWASMQRMFLF